jgi:hypothetical protein
VNKKSERESREGVVRRIAKDVEDKRCHWCSVQPHMFFLMSESKVAVFVQNHWTYCKSGGLVPRHISGWDEHGDGNGSN